jgi:hypothetical protein
MCSTDDFDGVLYNATNLAVKGIASIAACVVPFPQ